MWFQYLTNSHEFIFHVHQVNRKDLLLSANFSCLGYYSTNATRICKQNISRFFQSTYFELKWYCSRSIFEKKKLRKTNFKQKLVCFDLSAGVNFSIFHTNQQIQAKHSSGESSVVSVFRLV